MGGVRSATFHRFRELVIKGNCFTPPTHFSHMSHPAFSQISHCTLVFCAGFLAARRHADAIVSLAELSLAGSGAQMPCFVAGRAAVESLKARALTHPTPTRTPPYPHNNPTLTPP